VLDGERVALAAAKALLRRQRRWALDRLWLEWTALEPRAGHWTRERLLRALRGEAVVLPRDEGDEVVRLSAAHMPSVLAERLDALFEIKSRFSAEELEPYVAACVDPAEGVDAALLRCLRFVDGNFVRP